ncbi:DUF4290 domain-containing protein [Mucilaginibacter lappiensis]|uniref:DUF4290 domain-containing protein n=1 Tax=Mucilaginibacter lappiensis TaxID=354630 RepID=A0A1N7BKA7_9SPHI|nr:DUF4290 domain-containing protein [Mucilaginibacter lappiensis]MBB6110145.1 hypothetical protein [Mucilaginibacter lappiensis]MBB6126854.1 hypothetical protein [Mucilaginibacter lappiensis]SIR51811.1 protein of unknown function [Mucilaginibacter lappiensis]
MAQQNTPEFDYNSTRNKLILSEYGRNVQNMVKYIVALPTKEERNRYAQVVIDLMGFLNPHLRDVADFKHKLWDHLHIISDYKIDVDSPYPKPSPEAIHLKPQPLRYPHQRIKYKHYGKTIELMIEKAKSIDDADRKRHMVQAIANFMKMAYVQWNKDSVSDESILADLYALSGGTLKLEENINLNRVEFRPIQNNSNNNQNNRGRNQNNNQNNRGRSNQNNNQNNRSNNNNNQNNRNRNNGGAKKY